MHAVSAYSRDIHYTVRDIIIASPRNTQRPVPESFRR